MIVKAYVTFDLPEPDTEDGYSEQTDEVLDGLEALAAQLGGSVEDVELK